MEPGQEILENKIRKLNMPDISPEEVVQGYNVWSKGSTFDIDTKSVEYKAPGLVAAAVAKYMPEQKDISILDVGAGSGIVAEELWDLGYTNIDALDPSEGMLEVAKKKDLYRKYICAFFTRDVPEVETNAYDAFVTCAAISETHLRFEALPEMVRCVKTGGLVVFAYRESFAKEGGEFKAILDSTLKRLETAGQWQLLERTVIPDYFPNIVGVMFAFRVTK